MSSSKLDAIIAQLKAKKAAEAEAFATEQKTKLSTAISNASAPISEHSTASGMHGELITYNSEQQQFVNLVPTGADCVLIGAAGTGKTTCSNGAIQALIQSGLVPILDSKGHKHLRSGVPGIVVIAYTKRAVNNIRKVVPQEIKDNCITAHKLLEFKPEELYITDPETGEEKRTMRFLPSRNAENPLPETIHTIIVEEASMLGTDLYALIDAALGHKVQWIFIGDIQQLPPVFGPAILGYKLLELPVVELKQVYRQALESPIIRLAHRVLSGKPIPPAQLEEWNEKGKLTLHPWKKSLSADVAIMTLSKFFTNAVDHGAYDPDNDIILIPYNEACGTIELNKRIANHLAKKRGAITYEVMAGFNKHYFSVGDKILYDRQDAVIIDIQPNKAYSGQKVQVPSRTLDYHGYNPNYAADVAKASSTIYTEIDIDAILDAVSSDDERVTAASHILTIAKDTDNSDDVPIELSKAADINSLLLGYAITVHKSQGSEWERVFLCFHSSHATMTQREILYTGITRARETLYCICEPDTFVKGITKQRIKGNTLAEKAEYFKGRYVK